MNIKHSIEEKHLLRRNKVLTEWMNPDNKCSGCNENSLNLKKVKSIANPFKLQCNKVKCRKIIVIRNNTIF